MVKITSGDGGWKMRKPESTQLKQFGTYEEVLDFLFALKVKPKKTTIWPYFDKWCLSMSY